MKKVNQIWIPRDLLGSQMRIRTICSRLVIIIETLIFLYMRPKQDKIREWLRKIEKVSSVKVVVTHEPKVMVICAIDINRICYYELLWKEKSSMPPDFTNS